ncbi:prephenate dehydratase [Lactococcus nasutitermitis]|uniref:Prephenate dehydratase n=1 Tax=Lactococcus nasutitermitis TaxID=1652957 RepID=A0ABV9JCL1_9LACT|nr:prephenate dehydratase [Lactococcus nasutitermitis]
MNIAYLGPVGSFSHMAAKAAFPAENLLALGTISEVITAYDKKLCDFALIPIENSIEGTVNLAIDTLFHKSRAKVVAEVVLSISQNVLVTSKTREIEKIYSHPQALAQTRNFLMKNYPQAKLEITDSTASAAEFVKNHADEAFAAVANYEAAEIYGLEVLAENVQDVKDNNTRFWILGEVAPKVDNLLELEKKVSLALTLPENLPGALHKAISVFAWRGIDMTKIESRPLKTILGEYFFIIDLVADEKIVYALEELQSLGVTVRLLGNYNVYEA